MRTYWIALSGLITLSLGCSSNHTAHPQMGALPVSWYSLPEKNTAINESQPDQKTDAAVRSVFQATTSILSSLPSRPFAGGTSEVPWHLDGVIADFAISNNGIFGVLLSNGTMLCEALGSIQGQSFRRILR